MFKPTDFIPGVIAGLTGKQLHQVRSYSRLTELGLERERHYVLAEMLLQQYGFRPRDVDMERWQTVQDAIDWVYARIDPMPRIAPLPGPLTETHWRLIRFLELETLLNPGGLKKCIEQVIDICMDYLLVVEQFDERQQVAGSSLAGAAGLEPATDGLEIRCSIQPELRAPADDCKPAAVEEPGPTNAGIDMVPEVCD